MGKKICDSQRKNLKRYYHSFSFSFGVFYWFQVIWGHSMRFHFRIDPKPIMIVTKKRDLISQNINSNVFYSFTMRIVYFSPCKSKYFRYLGNVITTFRNYVRKVNGLRKLELTVFIICVDKSVVGRILSRNFICHAVARSRVTFKINS